MRSLAGLSTRTLRRSTRRYVSTGVGASLGVAVLFAILVTSAASRDALRETIAGQTGDADAVASASGAFDAVLPPGTVDLVGGLDGVDALVATTGFRSALMSDGAAVDLTDPQSIRDRIVFVTGIDPTFDDINRLDVLDGRRPTDGASEVMIPRRRAEALEVSLDDTVQIATPTGSTSVDVVGILADRGGATANQGSVLFTSSTLARELLGETDATTALQIDLAPGVDTTEWIDEHRRDLAGISVQDADDLAAGFASFIEGINGALTMVAAIAVFIGGFLIYLTFSVAVAERTRVLGTLRALGATRRRVQRVVVVEAVVLGATCAAIGVVLGYLLAGVSVDVVGGLLGLDLGGVGVPVGAAVVSGMVGLVVAAAASWVPARRAARIDPVTAMRGGALAIERTPRRWVGPLLLVIGSVLGVGGTSIAVNGPGLLLVLAGAVLSVHHAVGPVSRMIGAITVRLSRGTGTIAVRHLERERGRSSFTLALVMVALATIISVAATNASMSRSLDVILDEQAGAIQVFAPGAMEDGVDTELAAVPGVETLSPVRFGNVDLAASPDGGSPVTVTSFLQVIDPTSFFEVSSLPYTDGDDETTRAALAAGGALVLPAPEATRLGLGVGDTVDVTTLDGIVPFDVVGVYAVIGGGFGSVVGVSDLERLGGGRVNGFLVGTGDADPETVARALRSTLDPDLQLVVDSPAETRDFAEAQLAGFFSIAYAILVVAVVISMLGLANTLVVTILDRTREIGILRSTGARRRQIRSMVTVEAMTMAGVAFVLSVPLGAVLAFGIIDVQRQYIAAGLAYEFPFGLLAPLAVLTLVVAAVASALPARRAARLEIVDTLRFD